ncbi:MAG TPA: hypothetical protein VFI42_00195, partial [Thermomicrobiaceae bacterium]|nr:hypothetical protein [Thermomicrobiaceae bacterium]
GGGLNDCVVILPIVINQYNGTQLYSVTLLPFYIKQIGNNPNGTNTHIGQLVPNYIIYGQDLPAQFGWTPGNVGPIVIRMTN